ncbi:hypothetical protein AMATHDRAFT_62906 [Amanita thiersii Skay4041]|uniref:Nuclear pore complex protein NUP96 C-terminal domain-containing protein n=1 Tax=Amanita thiersii Skay4041 TaxID=703135 RepID=A0A2A9NJT1_9AGAR|nr:hypothetical protein AMATHDRAFT_62906 [Amanita thiersii Skay4041]
MARFRAFTSDDSSDDSNVNNSHTSESEEEHVLTNQKKRLQKKKAVADDSLSTSESDNESQGSSNSVSSGYSDRNRRRTRQRHARRRPTRNALVEGEDGELRYAHELAIRVSPPSTSPPPAGTSVADPSIIPWAQHIGVDAQKMHVMQTSLFRMPEEAAALRALNEQQPPKLSMVTKQLQQPLNRKHSRDSDGDGLRIEPRERSSFAHDIEPAPFRPFRKYARVESSASVVSGHEKSFADAGLALGRSFRAGWGPGGTLVHVGTICTPSASPKTTANSSIVTKSVVPIHSSESFQEASAALSAKLLQHHLSNTPITPDDAGVPLAYPSLFPEAPRSSPAQPTLNFASFASLFPTTDNTASAHLFRLGSALFDPIDLQLSKPTSSGITGLTPDVKNRIALLRRKSALSQWLKDAVKVEVETDLDKQTQSSAPVAGSSRLVSRPGPFKGPDEAFTLLTGYQVQKACDVAADTGYLKLATLISQAGGDTEFRADIQAQLKIWEDEKVLPLVERGVKKVYTLLAGVLESNGNGKDKDMDICGGLDWKRVFGLCLWYGEPVTASIADVFDAYESLVKSSGGKVARPFPPWRNPEQSKAPQQWPSLPWSISPSSGSSSSYTPEDPLYSLIRLHADPTLSLSHILNPASFGFGASHVDWAMCWHMYIILSRVMRVRDFGDREELRSRARSKLVNGIMTDTEDEEEEEEEYGLEGHSPSADLLASSYAFQLESQGMIQEAAFVLLHIEGSAGREKAVKDLLARCAPKVDEWMTRGLVGSLKIPLSWVNEAKALHSLNIGDVYAAYELYLTAGLYNPAHEIAVSELAPDAVIRRDLDLLKDMFERFEGKEDRIDGWSIKGKVILDYVHVMHRIPHLHESVEIDARASIVDAAEAQELEELTRLVPKIIGLLPDVLLRGQSGDPRHPAALEQMVKDLIGLVKRTKPLALSHIQQSTLTVADEATKMGLVRAAGYARFVKNIEIGVYS